MRRRGDRLNRVTLCLLGLIALAISAGMLLTSFKAFGADVSGRRIITEATKHFVRSNKGWFWPAVVGVLIFLGYVSYRWLRIQFHAVTGEDFVDVSKDRTQGLDRVVTLELSRAFNADVEMDHRIKSATNRVYVRGKRIDVELEINLDSLEHVDEMIADLNNGEFARLASAVGTTPHFTIRLRFSPHAVAFA